MSLNDILLSPDLRQRWYKNHITNTDKPLVKKQTPILFEGQNKRHILIAMEGKLKKEEKELVDNLMKACRISMEDVAFVHYKEQQASLADILEKLSIQKAILFGLPVQAPGLAWKEDEKIVQHGNCSILITSSPGLLRQDEIKRRALWVELKVMFGL